MRHLTTNLIHTIRDQVRGVRYSIRAEADTPGSALPRLFQDANLRPLIAIGSVVGTPALRMADGLLTQVETVTTDMLHAVTGRPAIPAFPRPIGSYAGGAEGVAPASFADVLYPYLKQALAGYGARNMLVSEQALDEAWTAFAAREGDAGWRAIAGPAGASPADGPPPAAGLVRLCAALAVAVAGARPIKRVEFADTPAARPLHLILSPNVFCGVVVGLSTAIVTLRPETLEDRTAVLESADAAVDARFARFKEALDGKDPAGALAAQFDAILPFLP